MSRFKSKEKMDFTRNKKGDNNPPNVKLSMNLFLKAKLKPTVPLK